MTNDILVLIHHGIKGQKWGVRNGPPYPLADNAHSSSEKTAGGLMTTLAIYTATNVALLAAYAGLVSYANDKADKRRTQQYDEEYYQKRKIKSLKDAPKIDPKSMSMSEHMAAVNPDYPTGGTTENCMFCSTAMAMRMKGYDVQAEECPVGWSSNNLESTWTGFKSESPKVGTAKDLEDYLLAQGEGAYGNTMVFWTLGGGHSLFYHVDNGKVNVYDTQANKMVDFEDLSARIMIPATEVIRLDNCEPTEMVLGAVKAREEKKA